LLIAWKFCPEENNNWAFWMLFDVNVFIRPHKSYKMTLEIASSENIMGLLAGDFFIDIKAGVGLHFLAELAGGKEEWQKMRETGTFFAKMRLFWTDGNGNQIDGDQQSPELLAILNCVPSISQYSYHDTGLSTITYSYQLPDDYLLPAHHALPILLTEALTSEALHFKDDKFRWGNTLRQDIFPISASEIAKVAGNSSSDNIVNYIIYQVPETTPEFLK
jgi:hypothetical protein